MNDVRWRAGCFGKVRSYGDFVTRNLPSGFVARWEEESAALRGYLSCYE